MKDESLVDHGAPEAHAMPAARTEQRERVVTVGLYHRVGLAGEDRGQMLDLEMLRQGLYQPDHQTHLLAPVKCRLRVDTVVAHAAVAGQIVLAEVVQEHSPAAHAGFGVGDGVHQQLAAYLLLGDRLTLHELLQLADVLVAVERDALGVLAVSAGPSGLLIIALDAFRDVVVDDKAHVGLVNAHPERYCRHDDLHVLHQEPVLILGTGLGVQPGMVRKRTYSVDIQKIRHLLNFLAAQAVYDPGLATVLLDVPDDVLVWTDLLTNLIVKIRPVERGLENRRVHDPEVLLDVILHLRGGRGGQRYDRSAPYRLHHVPDPSVLRSEIMPPLGDAMSLVHGVE